MSKVSIKVGPKTYSFNTADGDEEKIEGLAAIVDEKYQMLGHSRAVQETDNLVAASLFLADELEEARRSLAGVQQEKEKSGGKKAELKAEIETLRKAEERAREKNDELKAEIAQLREAASQQHDLFGGDQSDGAMIEKLETLAQRAEQAADTLESAGTAD